MSIEYRKDVLHVMICHAKDLAIPDGSKDEPNSYVKVYLRPDPHKATKMWCRCQLFSIEQNISFETTGIELLPPI